jgi:hypothetical protein
MKLDPESVTVAELIEHLQTFPPDMLVVTRICSDFQDLELPEKRQVLRKGSRTFYQDFTVEAWQRSIPLSWIARYAPKESTTEADFIEVCYFDGN